jgi:hypothetical protein
MKKLMILFSVAVFAAVFMVISKPMQGKAYATYSKWSTSNIGYYVDTTNDQGVDPTVFRADTFNALNAWHLQGGVNLTFTDKGTVTGATTGNDNKNVVMMRSDGNSAIATTYSSWSSSGIVDADIIIHETYPIFTSNQTCNGGFYALDTLTHEFGHFLGMAHSSVGTASMYYAENWCSTDIRSLDPDDISGIQTLYPVGSAGSSADISVSPKTLSFSADIQGSLPSPQSVTLSNTGTASSSWTTSSNQSFCHASPSSGTTAAGSSSPISVSMTIPSSTGTYSCIVSISDSKALNSPQQVSVSFAVTGTAPSDTTPPLVKITSPTDGSNVSGRVTIQATASDNVAISKVEFYIDNKLSATDTSYPYSYKWSINKRTTSGTHSITVKAYDPSGNTASASISVVK